MAALFNWRRSSSLVGSLVGLVLFSGMAAAQQAPALSALTVPAGALPDGCGLRPPQATPALILPSGIVLLPRNPWMGVDRKLRAAVRAAIDGMSRMPDAPPDLREIAALESKWADDVDEAYHAEYRTADGDWVFVSAVRFNDPKWAASEPAGRAGRERSLGTRIVHGATVVLVSGDPELECYQAIATYLQSVR